MEMEGQYVRGGYMPRVRGSAPPHLRTESQGPGRQTLQVPMAVFPLPLPIPLPLPLPLSQSQSPFVCCAAHLGLLCPRFPFPFLCLLRYALLCFALLCSPALFALASSGFIVGYSPDSLSFVQTVLYRQQGGLGIAQLRVKCSLYTQLCVCVCV